MGLHTISLCTGGAGLDYGLELAIPDARAIVLVEREAFAVAHLVDAMQKGILAPAPVWSDARTFDGRPWRGLVDGLIGGIPCQPHSLAGRKRGSLDERDLWGSARRIIVQARPWFVLIENVGGMLSPGDDEIAGAERVWRDLRKLGFAVEAGLFTAAEVGAPHERERIFILGVADCYDQHGDWSGFERKGRGGQSSDGCGSLADTSSARGAPRLSGPERPREEGDAGVPLDSRHALADTGGAGRKGREPARSARQGCEGTAAERNGGALVDPVDSGCGRWPDDAQRGQVGRTSDERAGRGLSLFPPGPGDIDAWRAVIERAPQFEPAVRRLADGLAANRIDWLRLLGNGVVPLAAAYAVRTLATRLADRGAAGATRLVGMMR